MKQRLDAAAERSGRSQSQEAELRLERSFDRQDLLPEVLALAHSPEMAGLLMMLGVVMEDVGFVDPNPKRRRLARSLLNVHWTDDPNAYDQAVQSAIALLNAARPRGKFRGSIAPHVHGIVREMVRAVRGDPPRESKNRYARSAPTIRSLIGPIADRLALRPPGRAGSLANALPPKLQLSETACKDIADAVLELVNSNPRTPSREEIAKVVLSKVDPVPTKGSQT